MKTVIPIFAATVMLTMVNVAFAQKPTQKPKGRPGDLRLATKLKPGDSAPDFTLRTMDGGREVTLSSYRGRKPVVLIFGSYT